VVDHSLYSAKVETKGNMESERKDVRGLSEPNQDADAPVKERDKRSSTVGLMVVERNESLNRGRRSL
jgi:hypothetical protein